MQPKELKEFNALKKNLKKDFSGLKEIKVAIVGDSATQFLTQSLKAYGYEAAVHFNIFEADYNQVDRQILDSSSQLYEFSPEFVIIAQGVKKLGNKFYKSPKENKRTFADYIISENENYYNTITSRLKAKVIFFNFAEVNDTIFGNFSNKTELSFIYQLRKLNYELMNLSMRCKNAFIMDYSSLHSHFGHGYSFDPKIYYNTDMTMSLDILPFVAKNITDIILSISGKFKKCLVLDLDNTTWGGIIGDDGIENIQVGDLGIGKAFTELQLWAKQLKERGIILAVCSKNTESTAKEPFEKHPDMVLRMDDIAVFVANWDNKADNIRYIQSVLNIGFDSMVFLDDNPFERNIVRENIPDILVPELPEDPAQYLNYLLKLNLFETASFSEEDENRTKQYQEEAGRVVAQKSFTNEDDFLKSLDMTSEVKPFDTFNVPRVSQLSQRSNQFNLRTVRYTEAEIEAISKSDKYISLTFGLKDKFGDNGLICVILLEKQDKNLFIDTWFMSCRVLKRGMENFTLNTIVKKAKEQGFDKIIGEYIPTSKNGMVKDHYEKLGFTEYNGRWELDVKSYADRKCFITEN